MKKITLLFTALLLITTAKAQPEEWHFTLSMGLSFPLGTYADESPEQKDAGYAEQGFSMALGANYQLTDNWSLTGNFLLGSNPVNENSVGNKLEQAMRNYYNLTAEEINFLTFDVDYWLLSNMMVGPKYTINFERVKWDFQALGGVNLTYVPNQQLVYDNPNNEWYYLSRNVDKTSFAFSYLAGTALRFDVNAKLNLRVGVDFYHSQAEITVEELRIDKQLIPGNSIETLNKHSTTIPIHTLNTSIGFVYYLD